MLAQNADIVRILGKILGHYGKGVDVDGLVADDQLLESSVLTSASTDGHACIINIQLISPHGQVLVLLGI